MAEFDEDAMLSFRNVVRAQLDVVEDEIITAMQNDLNIQPAFGGFEGATQAQTTYKTNFDKAWADLHRLKSALEAIDEACVDTMQNYGMTEDTIRDGLDEMTDQTDPTTSPTPDGRPDDPYHGV